MNNIYTAEQVATMTGKSRQAVTRWACRNPGIGKRLGDIWTFTDADVNVIRALRRGPKRKPKPAKQPAPTQPTPEPTP